jgi:hypothetical protein
VVIPNESHGHREFPKAGARPSSHRAKSVQFAIANSANKYGAIDQRLIELLWPDELIVAECLGAVVERMGYSEGLLL